MAALGQPELAIEAFKRSLVLNPSDASAQVNLATCYKGLNRNREALEAYQKAFALEPQLITGAFINHEYGFTLIEAGDLDRAADVFGKMIAERANKARGLRSLALLEMFRGRYGAAVLRLREAIVLNHADGADVSEFRDRMFLARALEAQELTGEFAAELATLDRMTARTSLGPEWLYRLAKIRARHGRVQDARRLLGVMSKTASDMTSGSSVTRDMSRDRAYLDVVRGEIDLAEGRRDEATKLFESAYLLEERSEAVESLATALVAAGRLDAATARYEGLIAQRPLGSEPQEHWLRAHVRLGELYERVGRADAARQMYQRLLAIWKDGDQTLVARKEAETRLAALSAAR
jgi:tetratricopeptide (TPR) repeat protein